MSVKRYEWVACDEHSCHCDVVESAEGDMVDYEDYAALEQKLIESDRYGRQADITIENLQMQVEKLAMENAVLNTVIEAVRGVADQSSGIAGWHLNGEIATWEEILPEIDNIETPATEDVLAEVRAQGVEMFATVLRRKGDDAFFDAIAEAQANAADQFAAQIRKGVQS